MGPEWERNRAREISKSVLDGKTTILEAARGLLHFAYTDAISSAEDKKLIIAIESETDGLPIGEVRKLWAPDALREKDIEMSRAEALWKSEFLEMCKRIVRDGSDEEKTGH